MSTLGKSQKDMSKMNTKTHKNNISSDLCSDVPLKEHVLLTKGVEEIFPSVSFLSKSLKTKRLRVFAGIDPTGPTLHIGHAIVLRKLKEFQDLGHEVILLIGDFTAMIGDPTDKMAVRKKLSEKEIIQNLKVYKKQASMFLRFAGKNKAVIKFNSKWLSKLNLKDILELTSLITVDQMLKRDMFARRVDEHKPIYIHEFMYPVLQGYDSVVLDVDVEIGGNDQMFNMLVGRDFLKKIKDKEKIAITVKLLADSSGKKMGKTEGNMVTLSDTHIEMFGKIMSWTDGMIVSGFELCTNFSLKDIAKIDIELKNGAFHPKKAKILLAKEVVKLYHGEKKANEAELNFEKTFTKGIVSDEGVINIVIKQDETLCSGLVLAGYISSVSDFRRLIQSGAVSDESGKKIKDYKFVPNNNSVYKVGKKSFYKTLIK